MLVVGIDIGGSKIRGILWNGRRAVRAREFPTPKSKFEFERRLRALIPELAGKREVDGIGIGAAGIVENRTLLVSPNIPYIRNFDFGSLWPCSVRLRLDNDARTFARAEYLRGGGRGAKRFFALTIGTGIGRAYSREGKIVSLKKFEYPEKWEKSYQKIRDSGDYERVAEFLGEKLVSLMKPFRPEVVVIGGGVVERRGFLPRLRSALKLHGVECAVRRSRIGRNAVAIGAALLLD